MRAFTRHPVNTSPTRVDISLTPPAGYEAIS